MAKKEYAHPTTNQPVAQWTCMECGASVDYQFGVCASCVAKISEREARNRVASAKNDFESQQYWQERRERRNR